MLCRWAKKSWVRGNLGYDAVSNVFEIGFRGDEGRARGGIEINV